MPPSVTITPPHRGLWSGLSSWDADSDLGVLGVPFDSATSYRKGAALAPAKIRAITPHIAPVTEEGMRLTGLRLHDYGDVPIDLNWDRYFAAVQAEAIKVLQLPFALFIGGDHSVTIPLVSAFSSTADGWIGYLQLDSHPDLMNEFNGHRWSHACTACRVIELPAIEPQHVAFIGIRSWLHDELDYLADHPEVKVQPLATYTVAAFRL